MEPTFWHSNDLVKLFPGTKPDAKPFTIHKDFACHYSPVFNAAFNSKFLEGQTQEYRLECDGINENVVRLLVHWIYTQRLELLQIQTENAVESTEKAEADMEFFITKNECLVKLWVLADKLLMPALQNAIIGALEASRREKSTTVSAKLIGYVCENTGRDSPLRRYMVAQYAGHVHSEWLIAHDGQVPAEFLADMVVLYKSKIDSRTKISLQPGNNMSVYKVPEE
ncbi:hypothetical protein EG329_011524 [Mollisiaceae sp. DMI_Dod_QoI]|nr:hypothetical protein EG329_011524 [Helotiales sp. DMI_Dod_QoI]